MRRGIFLLVAVALRRVGGGFVGKLREMTLGNGYLGSRYDEERSEMRYLV
jgi:hypothetical protein